MIMTVDFVFTNISTIFAEMHVYKKYTSRRLLCYVLIGVQAGCDQCDCTAVGHCTRQTTQHVLHARRTVRTVVYCTLLEKPHCSQSHTELVMRHFFKTQPNPKFLDPTQPNPTHKSLHPTQPNPSSTLGMAY